MEVLHLVHVSLGAFPALYINPAGEMLYAHPVQKLILLDMRNFIPATALLGSAICVCSAAPGLQLAPKELTSKSYQNSIKLEGLLTHARKWQEFADRANGTRSFGTPVS
jgi:hypothetical protein